MFDDAKFARPRPKQERSRATVDAILEAAARILESGQDAAFNTNRIAERAGVSIGTLYQHFPDKAAILREISRREMEALHADVRALAADKELLSLRRMIRAFEGRPRLRRAAVRALIAEQPPSALAASVDHTSSLLKDEMQLSRLDAFVLTRAVMGVVRAAVLEDSPFLLKPEFEEAILMMTAAYRRARLRAKVSRRSGSVRPAPKPRARRRA